VNQRQVGIELTRVTEAVAVAASQFIGMGDERELQQAARSRFAALLDQTGIGGTIAIGELEGGLLDGEICPGDTDQSLALKAVEGVSATALGGRNAMTLFAVSDNGTFPTIPVGYMQKVVIPPWAKGVELTSPPAAFLHQLAAVKQVQPRELRVVVMDRPRNQRLIEEIRAFGARISLIMDGDVAASLGILTGASAADCLLGSGGAREAVFTAAAARACGNQFHGRFLVRNHDDEQLFLRYGFAADKLRDGFTAEDLAPGDISFSATAITDSSTLRGIWYDAERIHTASLLFRSESGTIRQILSSRLRPVGDHHF